MVSAAGLSAGNGLDSIAELGRIESSRLSINDGENNVQMQLDYKQLMYDKMRIREARDE